MTTQQSRISESSPHKINGESVSPANLPTQSNAAPIAAVGTDLHEDTDSQLTLTCDANKNLGATKDVYEKQVDDHTPTSETQQHNAVAEKSLTELYRTSTSTSSSSAQTHHNDDLENSISRVSTDAFGNTYPEGGIQAYLVVFGCLCGCMMSLGLMNTISTYEAYVSTHQLAGQNTSTIGWIFGIYAFLAFFLGLQIGPLFDSYGPRVLVAVGSMFIILTYILLAWCTKYWHFIMVFSILGGSGTSLVFTPSIAAVGHWFYLKRGNFTGVACVGGSLGGIVFPLILQRLFNTSGIGWPWAVRIIGFINVPLAICANVFIRSRLPPKRPITKESILPDPKIFRDPTFALVTAAVFALEWGLFIPIGYLTSFALNIGVKEHLAYQLIAIFNAASCFGRWLPGLMADRFGRFNTMTITTVTCWVGTFLFWLPSEQLQSSSETTRLVLLIFFAVVFGFGSGAGISLVPVCVGQLCKTEHYGRYYATCYTVVSFASLTGIPIAGSLVPAANGQYWGLIIFTGVAYTVSTAIFLVAKGTKVGFSRRIFTERF